MVALLNGPLPAALWLRTDLMSANDFWAEQLAAWAIPSEILAQAPTSPWIHPVELFQVDPAVPVSLNRASQIALEALPEGGSVLDVGCGGGRGALALAERAGLLIGVDHQPEMLKKFAEAAGAKKLEHQEILGDWPAVADEAPIADIAIAHHVIYNVADLTRFAVSMNAHAKYRVVLEAPRHHPLSHMADLWLHFWGLERPVGPIAEDAIAVITEAGIPAQIEFFQDGPTKVIPIEKQVEFARIRLCLPESKDVEIREILENRIEQPRELSTIWWTVK